MENDLDSTPRSSVELHDLIKSALKISKETLKSDLAQLAKDGDWLQKLRQVWPAHLPSFKGKHVCSDLHARGLYAARR